MKMFFVLTTFVLFSHNLYSDSSYFTFYNNAAYYIKSTPSNNDTIFITEVLNHNKKHDHTADYHWDHPIVVAENLLLVVRSVGQPIKDSQYSVKSTDCFNGEGKLLFTVSYDLSGNIAKPLQKDWAVIYSLYEGDFSGLTIISNNEDIIKLRFHNSIYNTYGTKVDFKDEKFIFTWHNSLPQEPAGNVVYKLTVNRNGAFDLYKNENHISHQGLVMVK